MNRLTLLLIIFSWSVYAMQDTSPICQIDHRHQDRLLSVLSGTATGFAEGRIYVTVTNANRKYITLTDQDGKWALSYADIEPNSHILCWQDGHELTAETLLSH